MSFGGELFRDWHIVGTWERFCQQMPSLGRMVSTHHWHLIFRVSAYLLSDSVAAAYKAFRSLRFFFSYRVFFKMRSTVIACLLTCASTALAETIPPDQYLWGAGGRPTTIVKRQTATSTSVKVADSACTHGPSTRACWSDGYSAATDFDEKWPSTGKTVTYNLELQESTCNPDGGDERPCLKINGQFPGPTIYAGKLAPRSSLYNWYSADHHKDWGDIVLINFKNSVRDNGTGIHWHGMRQLTSCAQDGVGGITECPLAPGDTKTYSLIATQFGTSWYHSHFSAQYGDGAFGAIVINGPASSNYDYDLGPYIVGDWYYKTSWQMGLLAHSSLQSGGPPPPADTIIINGTNINGDKGAYARTFGLIKGKKYRLRIINTSADNTLRVSLDNHKFTVSISDTISRKLSHFPRSSPAISSP